MLSILKSFIIHLTSEKLLLISVFWFGIVLIVEAPLLTFRSPLGTLKTLNFYKVFSSYGQPPLSLPIVRLHTQLDDCFPGLNLSFNIELPHAHEEVIINQTHMEGLCLHDPINFIKFNEITSHLSISQKSVSLTCISSELTTRFCQNDQFKTPV